MMCCCFVVCDIINNKKCDIIIIMNVLFVSTMMTNDDRVWCAVLWVRELRNVHLQVFFVGEKSSEYGCHVEQTNATF